MKEKAVVIVIKYMDRKFNCRSRNKARLAVTQLNVAES